MAAAAQKAAAEAAISAIGAGYDVTTDLRLKYCKRELIGIERRVVRDISIPGGICIRGVPECINCDKGERVRACSEAVSFQQMSERFNLELGLSGKIPSGHFNSAFDLSGAWQKDAASTKSLALDCVSFSLFSVALHNSTLLLLEPHVRQAVPASWDPPALARFIETYGTHVIVALKMGGKDAVLAKQAHSSSLPPHLLQQRLKDTADRVFSGGLISGMMDPALPSSSSYSSTELQDTKFVCKRKGGSLRSNLSHEQWCQSVYSGPDLISLSLVPVSSLLSGINGSGFLTHAINLYMRYKPPIEELHQFLDFQLPRQWAPVFGELAVGPSRKGASLQFSFMGPKLYVNTSPVEVGNRPVTGLRLYLEGKRSNCLAIHLQHLSSAPTTFHLHSGAATASQRSHDRRYYEKVQWKSFSHVCTAPVEADDDLSVVTGAHFEVCDSAIKKLLFLRLHFSKVSGATAVKHHEWDGSPGLAHKSGIISTLISTHFSTAHKPPPNPSDVNINSAIYPGGPPVHTQTPKLLKFVDTTEMTRGPQDSPGYWAVSGARLVVEKGKISIRVKYSLLTAVSPDEDVSQDF